MAVAYPANVPLIADGTDVDAATTNPPIQALTNRTDWLKANLTTATAGTQLILKGVSIESGTLPGMPVYYDDTAAKFKPALAATSAQPNNTNLVAATSFWQGVVSTIAGTTGDVVLSGKMTLTTVQWAAVIKTGVFAAGNYFLDALENGKINASAGTTGIYVGQLLTSGDFYVRPSAADAFLQHVHFKRTLVGDPAGVVVDPPSGGIHTVNVPNPALQGWLPATAVYFPGYVVGVQIPVGAKFGYNINQVSETLLQEVFPPIPPDNAQFSQGTSLLTDDIVVVNNYGIWWMLDTYGNAPWPIDYAVSGIATDVLFYTTRLIAELALTDLIRTELISDLATGVYDPYLTRKLYSQDLATMGVSGSGNNTDGFTGLITLENNGVTRFIPRRGLGVKVSGTTQGDVTAGYFKDFGIEANGLVNAVFEGSTASPERELFTTNGVSAGTTIAVKAYALGGLITDWLDFSMQLGAEYPAGQTYKVGVRVTGGVDVITGPVLLRDYVVEFYVVSDTSALSTTNLVKTVTTQMNIGTPGALQVRDLGPYADVIVGAGSMLLVRVKNSGGGSPVPLGKLRILNIGITLSEV